MSPLILIAAAVIAAAISYALTPAAGWLAAKIGAIDNPGPRKIHKLPIPRLGGVAVLASIAATMTGLAWFSSAATSLSRGFLEGLALGIIPVLAVSMFDDVHSVPAPLKALAHGVGAAVAVAFGFSFGAHVHVFGADVPLGLLAPAISWLWIVGVTNAFNLADGLDGLSAGLALISAGSLTVVALVAGDAPHAITAAVTAGALIGFLPFNTFPAKIFFGDTGAASTGFLLACLGLWGTARIRSGIAVLVPVLVMGVPIADAFVTILRRTIKPLVHIGRGGVFQPDQEHIHHRLMRKGLDHATAVRVLYTVGISFATLGVLSIFLTSQRAALVLMTVLAAAAYGIRGLDYDEFAIIKNGLVLRAYNMPALRTGAFRVFIDMALVTLSAYAAFVLKFDEWRLDVHRAIALDITAILLPVTVVTFIAFRLYRRAWRYTRIPDLLLTLTAIGLATTVTVVISRLVLSAIPEPTYFVIYALVLTAFVVSVRSSFRLILFWKEHEKAGSPRVLVYGADQEGATILQELFWRGHGAFQPVGFIDDNPKNHGRLVNGFPVFGSIQLLPEIAAEHRIEGLVVGSSVITAEQMAIASLFCGRAGIWLKGLRVELHPLPTGAFADTPLSADLASTIGGV